MRQMLNSKGMTLIEMLVALIVSSIMMSVLTVDFIVPMLDLRDSVEGLTRRVADCNTAALIMEKELDSASSFSVASASAMTFEDVAGVEHSFAYVPDDGLGGGEEITVEGHAEARSVTEATFSYLDSAGVAAINLPDISLVRVSMTCRYQGDAVGSAPIDFPIQFSVYPKAIVYGDYN